MKEVITRFKKCSSCRDFFPRTEDYFGLCKSTADGFQDRCKVCHRTANLKYENKFPGRVAHMKKMFKRSPAGKRAERKYYLTKRKAHPEKVEARALVRAAIASGQMKKPDHCEEPSCGRSGVKLEAHHDDYAKPLEVRWLCKWCHNKERQNENRRYL